MRSSFYGCTVMMPPYHFYSCLTVHFGAMLLGVQTYECLLWILFGPIVITEYVGSIHTVGGDKKKKMTNKETLFETERWQNIETMRTLSCLCWTKYNMAVERKRDVCLLSIFCWSLGILALLSYSAPIVWSEMGISCILFCPEEQTMVRSSDFTEVTP